MNLITPGILWTTLIFTGVLCLNRTFVAEKEQGCLEALMICPVNREVIYFGKVLGNLLFMAIIEVIVLPIFIFLFNLPIFVPQLILITILATIGFITTGTLFAAIAVNTKAREMILPILFLPVISPIIISAVESSKSALELQSWSGLSPWIQIIIAFDIIFTVVSFLVFAYIIEE
jgi:heme exporter protein B